MRFDINSEMKRKIVVYSVSMAIGILLFAIVNHLDTVLSILSRIIHILAPFLAGLAFAAILDKPEQKLQAFLEKKTNMRRKTCRVLSCLVMVLGLILFVLVLVGTAIPALIDSFKQFTRGFGLYSATLANYIQEFSTRFGLSPEEVERLTSSLDLFPTLSEAISEYLPRLAEAGMDVAKFMMNLFIAFAATFYLLLDKDSLILMVKKMAYSLFRRGTADFLSLYLVDVQRVFEQYIVSNLLDSTVVGILCWVGMMLLKIPYAPMIGFIVGVTNIIPVFGPFLGAIPVIIILLLIKPVYALVFAIFILVLQQVDGNVLKPVIMGDRLGVSGFWILFSVTVGGSLFGIIGMFLGVPIFALIYAGVREFADLRLSDKRLEIDTDRKVIDRN